MELARLSLRLQQEEERFVRLDLPHGARLSQGIDYRIELCITPRTMTAEPLQGEGWGTHERASERSGARQVLGGRDGGHLGAVRAAVRRLAQVLACRTLVTHATPLVFLATTVFTLVAHKSAIHPGLGTRRCRESAPPRLAGHVESGTRPRAAGGTMGGTHAARHRAR